MRPSANAPALTGNYGMHVLPVRQPGPDDQFRRLRPARYRLLRDCGQPDRRLLELPVRPRRRVCVRSWDMRRLKSFQLVHCRH